MSAKGKKKVHNFYFVLKSFQSSFPQQEWIMQLTIFCHNTALGQSRKSGSEEPFLLYLLAFFWPTHINLFPSDGSSIIRLQ